MDEESHFGRVIFLPLLFI